MSGIILPASALDEIAQQRRHADKASHESDVRWSISQGLKSLSLHLGYYEQTTQASVGPFTIEQIAEQLIRCWHEPTPFNVSELGQRAEQLGGRA